MLKNSARKEGSVELVYRYAWAAQEWWEATNKWKLSMNLPAPDSPAWAMKVIQPGTQVVGPQIHPTAPVFPPRQEIDISRQIKWGKLAPQKSQEMPGTGGVD